jgi:predicted ATPase/DNA-binding SARP family transcriptional activator
MVSTPQLLEVTTLGRFEIRRQQHVFSGGNWNRRKVRDLFKLLISAEQHRLHREQIQEILWPESASEQAANSFGKTLYLLRRALEPDLLAGQGGSSTYVTLDGDTLALVPDSIQIDADLFEASVKQLQVQLRSPSSRDLPGQGQAGMNSLLDEFDQVLSLYGGDYLPEDLYEDWAQRRRDRLRRIHSWLLENAAELAIAYDMGLRACEYLLALLERNPAEEQAHRQLMLIYARMGRRSDALSQFQMLREALREELRTNPLPETIELYRSVQAGRIPVDLAAIQVRSQPVNGSAHVSVAQATAQATEDVSDTPHTQAHQASDLHTSEPETPVVDVAESEEQSESEQPDPEAFLKVALVERDEEMQRLQRAYTQAVNGQCRVFVISGEPGIGKTRLAREMTSWVETRQQSLVLWGYCYEMSGMLPYQPIVAAIEAYVRTCSPEQLRRILGNSAGDLAKIVLEIRSCLPDLPPAEVLGPEVERRNLYSAVARFFNTLAAERPLALIFDDLQWADTATIELLTYLTSQASTTANGGPLPLYIFLYRADEVHEHHPLRGLLSTLSRLGVMDEVRLKRLDEKGVQQLLENLAGHSVRPIVASEIYRYTEGNPFFVGETILALVQEGKVKRVGDRWQTTVDREQWALPQSVRLLIERRLVHISPECRTTLALAAVLGRQFSSALLCEARNLSEEVVAEHVDDAIRLSILMPCCDLYQEPSGEYAQASNVDADLTFTHDKIREVLYQRLNPLRRRTMHRQVAQAIESYYAQSPTRLQAHYGQLAHHYQMAEDYTRAVDYFLKAARQATHVYAFVNTAHYIEKALDLLIGEEDRALRAELLRQLAADVYLYIGHTDLALEAGMAACTLWRDLGNVEKEAETRLDVAFAFHWQGRSLESIEHIKRAMECLEQIPTETRLLAKAYTQWALAATHLGDPVSVLENLQRAEELHEQIGNDDPFITVVTFWTRSWYCFLAGTPQHMLENALQAAEVCRRTYRFGWEPMMTYSAAWAYMLLGRIEEGEQVARDTLAKSLRHNAVGAQGWAHLVLAFLAIQQARWEEAEQAADNALTIARMLYDVDLEARVLWSRSLCAGWRSDWDAAIAYVLEAIQLMQREEDTSMVYPYLLIQSVKAHYYAGKLEEAQSYLDQAMRLSLERKYRQLPAIGWRLQGRILQEQGQYAAALPYFERSLTELATLDDTLEYARTEEAYGLFYLARQQEPGDSARGQELLDSARATFTRLGVKG